MRLTAASLVAPVREGWRSMFDACGFRSCRNTVFMRGIQSRVGVTVGQDWYCGVDCFVASIRGQYASLSTTKVIDIRHAPRRPLGLLLLAKGFITEAELRNATAESELRGEDIEQTLSRSKTVTDQQIALAKAAQWGCPVYGENQPIVDVEAGIPTTLLRACSGAPLHYSAGSKRTVLGFCDRVEHSFLNALEEITGVRAESCFVTRARFAEQLAHLSAPAGWEEIVLEHEYTPVQMANTTGQYAVEIRALDARSTRCQDFIWTRLIGKRHVIDLLYRIRSPRRAASLDSLQRFQGNAGSLA